MTVKELIEKLGKFPDDQRVEMDCFDCEGYPVEEVESEDDVVVIRDYSTK